MGFSQVPDMGQPQQDQPQGLQDMTAYPQGDQAAPQDSPQVAQPFSAQVASPSDMQTAEPGMDANAQAPLMSKETRH